MHTSQKGMRRMSAEAITVIRTLWPRHTAKHIARRWGRATRTAKQWLRNGVPEYLLQTVLADLDEELASYERELTAARESLRKARDEGTAPSTGGAAGAIAREAAARVRSAAAGRE